MNQVLQMPRGPGRPRKDPRIQSGIPLPEPKEGKWAWVRQMRVGDSFLSEKRPTGGIKRIFDQHGMKLAYRQEGKQYRIWRTV